MWKLQMQLRSKRPFSTENWIVQYKQQVLSFIESAVVPYTTSLELYLGSWMGCREDSYGINDETAFMGVSLAPLSMRRDIAMLGILHRATISEGPVQFQKYFTASQLPQLI